MTPNEWFETKGSKPEIRESPKRRHFAAIAVITETCPFQQAIARSKKSAGVQRVRAYAPSGPVWRQRTTLTLTLTLRPAYMAAQSFKFEFITQICN